MPKWDYQVALTTVSLSAIGAAFLLATSSIEWLAKLCGFLGIVTAFLILTAVINYKGRLRDGEADASENLANSSLAALEEIGDYFGGTIKTADALRFVASKVFEILPVTSATLWLVDRSTRRLTVAQAQGTNAALLREAELGLDAGLAGRCAATGSVQIECGQMTDAYAFPPGSLSGFRSSAAIPLARSGDVAAVLQFYSDSQTAFGGESISLIEAVGERVTRMILSSLSYERSLAAALNDPVTDLPNERAFRLVLENQIAESHRRGGERPLTVLAIDIQDFDQINERFGHAAGERLLAAVAQTIRWQLRQMDFIARSSNDEFLAILPTADEGVAAEVVERIITAMFAAGLTANSWEPIKPELNFGIAAFGIHGDTAETMLAAARIRKDRSDGAVPAKVIWFPGQRAN